MNDAAPLPGLTAGVGAVEDAATKAWTATHRKLRESRSPKERGLVYPAAVTVKGEPRLRYIERVLKELLKLGDFTVDGEVVPIDGFELRTAGTWVREGQPTPEEILSLLSARCRVKCEFCYLRMDVDETITEFNTNSDADILDDIDYRLGLLEQDRHLFSPTFQLEEVLSHPKFFDVARRIRRRTDVPIYVSTTGSDLTEEVLDQLEALEPVEIRVSLNAVDPSVRRRLMRDRHSVVVDGLASMHRRNMRFSVSLVIWPTLTWEEIERTVRFADACAPYGIYAILPGYTKAFSAGPLMETDVFWGEATRRLCDLRFSIDAPLIIHPRLFEEIGLGYPANLPLVIGIVPGSPAAMAGVRIGDVVTGIDGLHHLVSRRQVVNLFELKRAQGAAQVIINVRRGAEDLELRLRTTAGVADGYRHGPPFVDHFGVVIISEGIAIGDLRELGRIAAQEGAGVVAVATSAIVEPGFRALLREWKSTLFAEVEIIPFVPPNDFFGGNILLGELCTASDFLTGIEQVVASRPDVELVVIPSPAFAPGGWWHDLAGVSFTRLQRSAEVPVRMLVCSSFE